MFIEPVFGKKFFGREEILATLHKRVTAVKGGYRQNLALTGPMLAGKSSILRHFLKTVKSSDILPVYVEMVGEDFRSFCERFMATLLYQYQCLHRENGRTPVELDPLREVCRESIPSTVRQMDEVLISLDRRRKNIAYEKLLDITSIFKAETGKKCVIVLDEFHNLAGFDLKKPFQVFGKYIMVQKNTMYIVSSSQKTLLKEILSRKLSLLFGNFEVIEVNGFDNQTARSFIADKQSDILIPDHIENYIIQLSQGNPFYLETILKRYVHAAKPANDGTKKDPKACLMNSFSDLLYEANGVLNQYFSNTVNFFLEKKTRKQLIPILVSLARGNSQIKDMQKDIGRVDRELRAKLEQLQNMDLIYKSGIFYKVQDRLFEFWLKNVYGLKADAVVDEMDVKYLEFCHSVENDFSEYCEFNSRSVTDVVSALFSSFRNEMACIGTHQRKVPVLEPVTSRRISGNTNEIIGHTGENAWVCRIKEGDIAEETDVALLAGCRVYGDGLKVTRRIMMPLNGIENTAFLLAKEHNIWVWDIEQLNRMLRLFGKFELAL